MLLIGMSVVQTGINIGDIIYQLFAFVVLLAIPVALILFFVKRNSRLKRIEEKLDRLLEEEEKR